MQRTIPFFFLVLLQLGTCGVSRTAAQFGEEETIRSAMAVLNETMATAMTAIPQSMLANAHGVAIIPGVLKGSFVIGARHGRGVLLVRDPNGVWHAPVFISLTGGNVGWQAGVQSSDIVLVFKTQKSVQGLLSGKLTLGADAAAAAGPVGRQASLGTDGRLAAEIYSYSRSRGLFAGVSIDGSVLRVDQLATGAYYRSPGQGQPPSIPTSAIQLTQYVAALTGTSNVNVPGQQQTTLVEQHLVSESDIVRSQLVRIAPELFELLDPAWHNYLALPASLFIEGAHPEPASLKDVLLRYEMVANDPNYAGLNNRPEFHSVYGLLRHYVDSLNPSDKRIILPPPPIAQTAVLPP